MPENIVTDPAIAVLTDLVRTIEATGGLLSYADGTFGCEGDPEWLDLADVALKAQKALKEKGVESTLTITPVPTEGDDQGEDE